MTSEEHAVQTATAPAEYQAIPSETASGVPDSKTSPLLEEEKVGAHVGIFNAIRRRGSREDGLGDDKGAGGFGALLRRMGTRNDDAQDTGEHAIAHEVDSVAVEQGEETAAATAIPEKDRVFGIFPRNASRKDAEKADEEAHAAQTDTKEEKGTRGVHFSLLGKKSNYQTAPAEDVTPAEDTKAGEDEGEPRPVTAAATHAEHAKESRSSRGVRRPIFFWKKENMLNPDQEAAKQLPVDKQTGKEEESATMTTATVEDSGAQAQEERRTADDQKNEELSVETGTSAENKIARDVVPSTAALPKLSAAEEESKEHSKATDVALVQDDDVNPQPVEDVVVQTKEMEGTEQTSGEKSSEKTEGGEKLFGTRLIDLFGMRKGKEHESTAATIEENENVEQMQAVSTVADSSAAAAPSGETKQEKTPHVGKFPHVFGKRSNTRNQTETDIDKAVREAGHSAPATTDGEKKETKATRGLKVPHFFGKKDASSSNHTPAEEANLEKSAEQMNVPSVSNVPSMSNEEGTVKVTVSAGEKDSGQISHIPVTVDNAATATDDQEQIAHGVKPAKPIGSSGVAQESATMPEVDRTTSEEPTATVSPPTVSPESLQTGVPNTEDAEASANRDGLPGAEEEQMAKVVEAAEGTQRMQTAGQEQIVTGMKEVTPTDDAQDSANEENVKPAENAQATDGEEAAKAGEDIEAAAVEEDVKQERSFRRVRLPLPFGKKEKAAEPAPLGSDNKAADEAAKTVDDIEVAKNTASDETKKAKSWGGMVIPILLGKRENGHADTKAGQKKPDIADAQVTSTTETNADRTSRGLRIPLGFGQKNSATTKEDSPPGGLEQNEANVVQPTTSETGTKAAVEEEEEASAALAVESAEAREAKGDGNSRGVLFNLFTKKDAQTTSETTKAEEGEAQVAANVTASQGIDGTDESPLADERPEANESAEANGAEKGLTEAVAEQGQADASPETPETAARWGGLFKKAFSKKTMNTSDQVEAKDETSAGEAGAAAEEDDVMAPTKATEETTSVTVNSVASTGPGWKALFGGKKKAVDGEVVKTEGGSTEAVANDGGRMEEQDDVVAAADNPTKRRSMPGAGFLGLFSHEPKTSPADENNGIEAQEPLATQDDTVKDSPADNEKQRGGFGAILFGGRREEGERPTEDHEKDTIDKETHNIGWLSRLGTLREKKDAQEVRRKKLQTFVAMSDSRRAKFLENLRDERSSLETHMNLVDSLIRDCEGFARHEAEKRDAKAAGEATGEGTETKATVEEVSGESVVTPVVGGEQEADKVIGVSLKTAAEGDEAMNVVEHENPPVSLETTEASVNAAAPADTKKDSTINMEHVHVAAADQLRSENTPLAATVF